MEDALLRPSFGKYKWDVPATFAQFDEAGHHVVLWPVWPPRTVKCNNNDNNYDIPDGPTIARSSPGSTLPEQPYKMTFFGPVLAFTEYSTASHVIDLGTKPLDDSSGILLLSPISISARLAVPPQMTKNIYVKNTIM
jgi:hypothetical protein